jgi:CRP/FNR family transcriptional regulator
MMRRVSEPTPPSDTPGPRRPPAATDSADLTDDAALALSLYPALARLPVAVRHDVMQSQWMPVDAAAGTVLFDIGQPCAGFPMVLSGAVRVERGSAGGRTLELYRITPGELCVLSTAGLFGGGPLNGRAVALEPTHLRLLSPSGFERWCGEPAFRELAFGAFADRLADLMALVDAVAFQRLDQRLAHALLGRGHVLSVTHHELADELGTVREIVTRLLKRFERAGWVRLGRERIEVLEPQALRHFASNG